ncbi:hypothetical protein AB0K14_07880 [Actinosynnema sp. NPDC050801]
MHFGQPDLARQQWQLALHIFDALDAPKAAEIRARIEGAEQPTG